MNKGEVDVKKTDPIFRELQPVRVMGGWCIEKNQLFSSRIMTKEEHDGCIFSASNRNFGYMVDVERDTCIQCYKVRYMFVENKHRRDENWDRFVVLATEVFTEHEFDSMVGAIESFIIDPTTKRGAFSGEETGTGPVNGTNQSK